MTAVRTSFSNLPTTGFSSFASDFICSLQAEMLPLLPEKTDARRLERLLVRRGRDLAQARRRAVLPADALIRKRTLALTSVVRPPLSFSTSIFLERGFHLLDDALERDFIGDREIGKNLAIEPDVGGFQAFRETAVGQALRADGGVESLNPEIAESCVSAFCDRDRPNTWPFIVASFA